MKRRRAVGAQSQRERANGVYPAFVILRCAQNDRCLDGGGVPSPRTFSVPHAISCAVRAPRLQRERKGGPPVPTSRRSEIDRRHRKTKMPKGGYYRGQFGWFCGYGCPCG